MVRLVSPYRNEALSLRLYARWQSIIIFISLVLAFLMFAFRGNYTPRWLITFLVVTFTHSIIIGNLMFFTFGAFQQRIASLPDAGRWISRLAYSAVMAAIGAIPSVAVLRSVGISREINYQGDLINSVLISVVSTVTVTIVLTIYVTTRRTLEAEVARERHKHQQAINEVEKAREIQEGLLPREIPRLPGVELAARWQPATVVGGDFYDVIRFGEHRAALCVADVVGKGITAALLMANLQAAVRAFASPGAEPAEVCSRLNEVILGNVATGKFITLFYAVLDTRQGTLHYCNAGHNPPFLIRGNGSVELLQEGGAVLGVFPDWRYEQGSARLQPGDRVLIYSDGLSEARNQSSEEFGDERLASLLVRHRSLHARDLDELVFQHVAAFCQGEFHDDATMLLVSVR